MVGNKMKDSTKHLLCCVGLEVETFHLYECVARKINYPEFRSLIVNIAYDTMKHSQTIKELLRSFETVELNVGNCRNNWQKLWNEIVEASEQISEMGNISDEEFCEIFKNLAELEDCLSESYHSLLELRIPEFLAKELGESTQVNPKDLTWIFERIIEDKQRHKETLIEIGYRFAAKETERAKDSAPVVRYQNPDAWSRLLFN